MIMIDLFKEKLNKFPRVELTRLPTPLARLDYLSELMDINLYIKRDDLTDLALGGDKPRKLEYEIAQAKLKGANSIGYLW